MWLSIEKYKRNIIKIVKLSIFLKVPLNINMLLTNIKNKLIKKVGSIEPKIILPRVL